MTNKEAVEELKVLKEIFCNKKKTALGMAIRALENPEPPKADSLKCKDCEFLDFNNKCCLGYYCMAPKNWRSSTSKWHQPSCKACKTYFKRRGTS